MQFHGRGTKSLGVRRTGRMRQRHVHQPLIASRNRAAAGLARRDQRLESPFDGQVARITQSGCRGRLSAVHDGAPQEQIHHPRESAFSMSRGGAANRFIRLMPRTITKQQGLAGVHEHLLEKLRAIQFSHHAFSLQTPRNRKPAPLLTGSSARPECQLILIQPSDPRDPLQRSQVLKHLPNLYCKIYNYIQQCHYPN